MKASGGWWGEIHDRVNSMFLSGECLISSLSSEGLRVGSDHTTTSFGLRGVSLPECSLSRTTTHQSKFAPNLSICAVKAVVKI